MPKVSIVIPCYNLGPYINQAIKSVLGQTMADFEIIVVDDGSTDDKTRWILQDSEWRQTRSIRTENRGVSAARNLGISKAHGQYVLPLDADDWIGPDYLRQAVEVLDQRPEVGIVYCGAELSGELKGNWYLPEFSLPHQLLDNLIFSAALFRRADWQAVGGYSKGMQFGWEDWDFWNRLLGLDREVVKLPSVQFHYRIRRHSRERSLSRLGKSRLFLEMLFRHRKLYRRHAMDLVKILYAGERRRPGSIRIE